jgi:predicted RNA-binding Zn-ribbon protein involved in translation (DUF1610 family)
MKPARAVQVQQSWEAIAEEVFTGFREWRVQHPRATYKEIETALDARWTRTRARVLADAAMSSAVCDLREQPVSARPVCPDCGGHLVLTGQEARELTTTYEQGITLTRSATICTACQRRVFPPG